ncbi:carbon-nitrogen hydrolase family protein [Corynebacterium crudilactis]|uniref:Amidohydrolase n=1 Tax=Corynebacterium crudilactis TaxID=1652495 RepID=A0A172QW60_9CORY|nr:carbon-nitrogen hydrolase family protein [Corynebacterium crudilactis]ANE04947.1 amidohydrolase [Corynebacterium crudilactis]
MRIALLQISTNFDKMDNFSRLEEAAKKAAKKGARVLVFPEATSQSFGTGRLDTQAEDLDGEFSTAVKELAVELNVVIIAGMFSPADTVQRGEKTIARVNNTVLISGAGMHQGYDKIHTYDAFGYKESDTVKPGDELVVFDVDGITFGVATCYDIRFPEQFKDLARKGAQVIVVPTSWQDGPGKLEQWKLLPRARALDSTSWIVACGQARLPKEIQRKGPTGIGHSMVVNPTGEVVVSAGYEPQMLIADIDVHDLGKIREMLPVL